MTDSAERFIWRADDDPIVWHDSANKGWSDAWMHELRGHHGEWSRTADDAIKPLTDKEQHLQVSSHVKIDLSNLWGVDPALQHEIRDRLQVFAKKYPFAAQTIVSVESSQTPGAPELSPRTMAATQYILNGGVKIYVNTGYYQDKDSFSSRMSQLKEEGFHPLGSTHSVIDHELGHVVDFSHFDGTDASMPSQASGIWRNDTSAAPGDLSGYAKEGSGPLQAREAFAEGFMVQLNNETGDPEAAEAYSKLSAPMRASLQGLKQFDSVHAALMPKSEGNPDLLSLTCEGYSPGGPITSSAVTLPDSTVLD